MDYLLRVALDKTPRMFTNSLFEYSFFKPLIDVLRPTSILDIEFNPVNSKIFSQETISQPSITENQGNSQSRAHTTRDYVEAWIKTRLSQPVHIN